MVEFLDGRTFPELIDHLVSFWWLTIIIVHQIFTMCINILKLSRKLIIFACEAVMLSEGV